MKWWPPHIEAEVHFLSTEEGGRRTPIYSGYRPQFYYDGWNWDAIHEYPGRSIVHPGETVTALLSLLSPRAHRGKLYPGKEFELREGARVVGRGRVTRLLELGEEPGCSGEA